LQADGARACRPRALQEFAEKAAESTPCASVRGQFDAFGFFRLSSSINKDGADGFLARERSNLAALSCGINVGHQDNPPRGGGSGSVIPRRVVELPARTFPSTQLGEAATLR
jgi:hypothetical protein